MSGAPAPRDASATSRPATGSDRYAPSLEDLVAQRDIAHRRYLDAQRQLDGYLDASTAGT